MSHDFKARVKHHAAHIEKHLGGQAEVEAIATAETTVLKATSEYASLECFESQIPVGSFTTADKIKIRGGAYKWRNTGDGCFTVYDVPLVSEWKKGDHGAPYAGDKETLEEFVATAQKRYKTGNFCATAYKRHNPDVPFDHPDFRGYVLPNRVGKYSLERGDKWTIFGDLKLTGDAFQEAKEGRIPYVSVEIPWAKRRIRGLSFQDTLPPEYEYALFTLGEEVVGPIADGVLGNFAVSKDSAAKFMDDDKDEKSKNGNGNGDSDAKKDKGGDEDFDKRVSGHIAKNMGKYVDDHMKKHGAKYMSDAMAARALMQATDPLTGKGYAKPSEPNEPSGGTVAMTEPELAAKMTAQAGEIADLKARLDKQDGEKAAASFVARAEKALSAKIVTPAIKEQIAMFASEWAPAKDGEARFDKFIDALKPSLKDKPTSETGSMTTTAVDLANPVLAKIAKDGPDRLEEAGKFSAQWGELKRMLGDRFATTEEDFVKQEMGLAKAKRDGFFNENGR